MSDLSRVHMIGIGGAGMSGLARILLARGSQVTGSDMKDSTPVEVLRTIGASIAVGHAAENLTLGGQEPTCVVTSFAAIPQDNPELVAAREKGIEVIRRSDLLAELMQGAPPDPAGRNPRQDLHDVADGQRPADGGGGSVLRYRRAAQPRGHERPSRHRHGFRCRGG